MPAQATSTSIGPSAAAISATATIRACRSVTSTAACATVAPWAESVCARSASAVAIAIDQADRRPLLARATAVAWPIPWAAPVTSTIGWVFIVSFSPLEPEVPGRSDIRPRARRTRGPFSSGARCLAPATSWLTQCARCSPR